MEPSKITDITTCPKCKSYNMTCIDSRKLVTGVIRRRKECTTCGNRITTIELLKEDFEKLQ